MFPVRALLLALATWPLTFGGAAYAALNLTAQASSPAAQSAVTPGQVQAALNSRPTLRLLVLTLALRDLVRAGTLTLNPNTKLKVRIQLAPLNSNEALKADAAQNAINALLATLTPEQRQALDGHIAARDARARQLAGQNAASNTVQGVLYLLIPGGRTVVDRLTRQPEFNPYRNNPANTDVLSSLLALLN